MKNYAVIGSWDWDGTDTAKGMTIAEVSEKTGNLRILDNYLPDVKFGCTAAVRNDVIYFTDERKTLRDRRAGGGGYVYAAKITDHGKAEIISCVPSLGVNPSYCTCDNTGKYLIAVHHSSFKNCATKIRRENGKIVSETVHDDAPAVLFALNEDGTVGKALDAVWHAPEGEKTSLLHSVYCVPGSDILVIFDKGLDRIYSYAVRRNRLILKDTLEVPEGSDPRYGAFHPVLPLFYGNNEQSTKLYTISISKKTGKMKICHETELMKEPMIAMASDIAITPDAEYLYTALRMADVIAVCRLDEKGIPSLIGTVEGGGRNARGMAVSRDGRYLYICNTESDVITVFRIQKNGMLKKSRDIPLSRPANLRFL